MNLQESFPDNKFGKIKIKFPDGDVQTEKVFFYKNTVSESPDNKKRLIYDYIMNSDGHLKILIDLSTVGSYYSDKYQFTIGRENLGQIMETLNQ